MGKTGLRFSRVAEAFDMAARARSICSESNGSEGQSSPATESFTELSDLVNSFIDGEEIDNGNIKEYRSNETSDENDGGDYWEDCMDSLRGYLQERSDDNDVKMKMKIQSEVELACRGIGFDRSSPEFKRRLMASLRERGFDAGVCKTKWGKTAQLTPGNYEYIDVNVGGNRYIVEVFLTGEFEVARSTDRYASLLEILPPIFVGKEDLLKLIARIMCRAIKKSMKKYEMHVPPWRRYAYMQAKWFSSNYKRSTNDISDKKGFDSHEKSEKMRSVGFVPMPVLNCSYTCREACVSKVGSRVGNLAMLMNGNELLLQ